MRKLLFQRKKNVKLALGKGLGRKSRILNAADARPISIKKT